MLQSDVWPVPGVDLHRLCADDSVYNVAWSDVARVNWPAPPKACTKCGAKTAKKPY